MSNAETEAVKVFIVEDHPAVRKMLGRLIRRSDGLALCGEAGSAEAALEQIPACGAQLVLVDISLPGMDGIELIRVLHDRYPHLLSLAISGHDEGVYAVPALRAGAHGYVMKGEVLKVGEAIRQVRNGEVYASDEVRAKLDRLA